MFGRRLQGQSDTLVGYRLTTLRIEDQEFVTKSGSADHRNLQFTGSASDYVEGTAFEVTRRELEQADAYEPDGYERVSVRLKSGQDAWVYMNKQQ
jgi:AIG2-like family.